MGLIRGATDGRVTGGGLPGRSSWLAVEPGDGGEAAAGATDRIKSEWDVAAAASTLLRHPESYSQWISLRFPDVD